MLNAAATLTLNAFVGNPNANGAGNLQPGGVLPVTTNFANPIVVNADSTVNVSNNVIVERVPSLYFASLKDGAAPQIVFTTNGLYVTGTTTLGAEGTIINANNAGNAGNAALWTQLNGQVTGGSPTKTSTGWLSLNSPPKRDTARHTTPANHPRHHRADVTQPQERNVPQLATGVEAGPAAALV